MNRRSSGIVLAAFVIAVTLAASGCSNPIGGPAPSVTVTAPYVPPTPTPYPLATPTPVPTPVTSWDGLFVKLYGNVKASGGDHVYGTVKVYYLDKNFWDDTPTVKYDTTEKGGAYSLDVRSNVPFKVELRYLYVGKISSEMQKKQFDDPVTIRNDTRRDFSVMTSNITPSY